MELIDRIEKKEAGFENIHFVEVMACPGGCVIGGGSPQAKTNTVIEKRLNATYSIDKNSVKRVSQDNEQLNKELEEENSKLKAVNPADFKDDYNKLIDYSVNQRLNEGWNRKDSI